MYKCEILADSVSPQGNRLTTFKITYPRIIHAEMCRHRMLSRNTASSRAIPFEKMVKDVQENPFIPIAWQKEHKGMQGTEYITDELIINHRRGVWIQARDRAIYSAQQLNGNLTKSYSKNEHYKLEGTGVTKQLCNRLLEPFVWTTELVSGTEWENFFSLRCPQYHYDLEDKYFKSKKDWLEYYKKTCIGDVNSDFTLKEEDWFDINKSQAEIHIQKIAEMMWDCYNESKPKTLQAGEWHIPNLGHEWDIHKLRSLLISGKYNDNNEITPDINEIKLKISTSHCARISYETLGDNPKIDYEADIKLYNRLLESKHLSCFEHCARAMDDEEYNTFIKGILSLSEIGTDIAYYEKDRNQKDNLGWCNNFKGFIQHRYLVENK